MKSNMFRSPLIPLQTHANAWHKKKRSLDLKEENNKEKKNDVPWPQYMWFSCKSFTSEKRGCPNTEVQRDVNYWNQVPNSAQRSKLGWRGQVSHEIPGSKGLKIGGSVVISTLEIIFIDSISNSFEGNITIRVAYPTSDYINIDNFIFRITFKAWIENKNIKFDYFTLLPLVQSLFLMQKKSKNSNLKIVSEYCHITLSMFEITKRIDIQKNTNKKLTGNEIYDIRSRTVLGKSIPSS